MFTQSWRFVGRTAALVAVALGTGSLSGIALATSAAADTAPKAPVTVETVSADSLPTVQIGTGIVWDQLVLGNTVYVAGEFSTARPAGAAAGTSEVSRSNLLAYDIRTGELLPWAPVANGAVRTLAASEDGTRIYVGGSFTNISGLNRYRLAALDPTSGQPIAGFQANVNARINDITVRDNTVYFGGIFSVVSGLSRSRLAAVSGSTGAITAWSPVANAEVLAITAPQGSGNVVVGGKFTTLGGAAALGLGAVATGTGAVVPWAASATVRNSGANSGIYALSDNGGTVFGAGYVYGSGGNLESVFAARSTDGALSYVSSCRGDTYDILPLGEVLYQTGHMHDCATIDGLPQFSPSSYQRAAAFTTAPAASGMVNATGLFVGQPAPEALHWHPDLTAGTYTGLDQAAWSVEGNADYVVLGGEFPAINGVPQQGLARFARKGLAPNREGPKAGQDLVPTATTSIPGSVMLAWRSSWDRDNQELQYEVLRGSSLSTSKIIGTMTRDNAWYNRYGMSFVDATAPAGTSQVYRIRVRDAFGNTLVGNPVTVTVPAGTPTSTAYAAMIRADGAVNHWRLGESSGTSALDWAGGDPLTLGAGATRGVAGAISGNTETATTFSGTAAVPAADATAANAPQGFSVETWFKTTTTRGGALISFGNSRSGNSSKRDRALYMSNSGQLHFAASLPTTPVTERTVISPQSYNDGAWHHAVASLGADGLALFVDGAQVAVDPSLRTSEVYLGYWRIAGDSLVGRVNQPTSSAFAGTLDEVAIYSKPLSAQTITAHSEARNGTVANLAPAASFTTSGSTRTIGFNASGSADEDGSIASYAWDFGDGTTGTGVTTSHQYPDAVASYNVTLTVTDNSGATNSVTKTVSVSPTVNVAPTAAFTTTATALNVGVDASTSADPDGSISSYAWDFGDGSTGTGAKATHAYAAPGTYTVTLTITDNRGATATTTQSVVVSIGVAGQAFAADTFERQTTTGWGTADTGGAWTITPSSTVSSVANGSAVATVAVGKTATARLPLASGNSTDLTMTVWTDAATTGGGAYLSSIIRGTSAGDYRVRLRVQSSGVVTAGISTVVAGTETFLTPQATVAGVTYAPGSRLKVRAQAIGAGPTQLRYKVWLDGTAEPQDWAQTVSDSTSGLQAAGSVGMATYVSGSSTAPVVVHYDELRAIIQ